MNLGNHEVAVMYAHSAKKAPTASSLLRWGLCNHFLKPLPGCSPLFLSLHR